MSSPELTASEVERVLQSRWPETRIEPSLARMQALMELMDSPHRNYPVIHIAGTNGKSSTARMVDELLRAQGLRTGRTTSPHLATVRERICIDGAPISEEQFVQAYQEIAPYLELVDAGHGIPEGAQQVPVSFFEAITAMAYAVFSDAPVDVAIVEVGMGGTWDATNIVDGQVCIITPIGLDHQRYLGDTIVQIAGEKAGIIKAGSTAILTAQDPAVAEVLLAKAAETGATVAREGMEFGVLDRQVAVGGQLLRIQGLAGEYDELMLHLYGAHQASNAAAALAAVEAFFGLGAERSLDPEVVRDAFFHMSSPGRLEVVRSSPTTIIDGSHNPAGMSVTVQALQEAFSFSRLIGVFAASSDKDVAAMLDLLVPVLDEIIISTNNSVRSRNFEPIVELARERFGYDNVHIEPELIDAIERAVELAESGEHLSGAGVLITGSVYTAGDARLLFAPDRPKPWERRG